MFKLVRNQFDCTVDVVSINSRGEDGNIVEVSVTLSGEVPLMIEEFHYRLKWYAADPAARWLSKERAEDLVGKKGIAAGMRNVRFQVKQKNTYIKEAVENPLYEPMKDLVDTYVAHYQSDFTICDCEALGRGADHFLWLLRPCGTWMIRCQCAFNDDHIRTALKDATYKTFLAKEGRVVPIAKSELMQIYQSFKEMREETQVAGVAA